MNSFWSKIINSKRIIQKLNTLANRELPTTYIPNDKDRHLKEKLKIAIKDYLTEGKKTNVSSLINGICSRANFYSNILPYEDRMIWIFHLEDLSNDLQKLEEKSLRDLISTLDVPIFKTNGKINYHAARFKLKLVSMLLTLNHKTT